MGMMDKIGGSGAAVAMQMGIDALTFLKDIRDDIRLMRENEQGKRHFELVFAGEAVNGTAIVFKPSEGIPQGFKFIPEHITATAPVAAKLQLYENRVDPGNLVEVVANIQEYANFTAGLIIEGPTELIARISGHTATGQVTIRVSGQLTKKIPAANQQV